MNKSKYSFKTHSERIFQHENSCKSIYHPLHDLQLPLIYPIILGAIVLKKMKKAQCKADFGIGWAIVTLLFVNLIAGIVLLVMKDEDFAKA